MDHSSALQCQRVHLDRRSALGCISVHWDHGSAHKDVDARALSHDHAVDGYLVLAVLWIFVAVRFHLHDSALLCDQCSPHLFTSTSNCSLIMDPPWPKGGKL